MPFPTKEKTNWKFILIVLILAILVGGVTLSYLQLMKKEFQFISSSVSKKTSSKFILPLDKEIKIIYEIEKDKWKEEFVLSLNEINPDLGKVTFSKCCFQKSEIKLGEELTCFTTAECGAYFKLIKIEKDKVTFETWYSCAPPGPKGKFLPKEIILTDKTTNWKTYRNDEYGFEIKYPGNIFTEKILAERVLPFLYAEEFSGLKLIHSIPIPHCGLSGLPEHCEPETQDITIGFFPLDKNFQDLITSIKDKFANGYLKEIVINGRTGITFELGAEGEGIFYYLIPLNQGKTFLITRSYISEKIQNIYQSAKNFIPVSEQEKLFNQIISTFRFLE